MQMKSSVGLILVEARTENSFMQNKCLIRLPKQKKNKNDPSSVTTDGDNKRLLRSATNQGNYTKK